MNTSGSPLASRSGLVAVLTEQILEGTLRPGQKLLSERALALESGLSRPVVREVLSGLQERGLVEIHPGRGAYVRAVGSMDLAESMGSLARQQGATPRHLVEARAMLEEQTASLAATRATSAEINSLELLIDAIESGANVVDRARSDLAFHALIAKASKNPVLETMFGSIAPLVFALQIRSLDDPPIVKAGIPLHQQVVAAIRAHDSAGAGRAMFEHVTLAYKLYGGDLDIPLDVLAKERLEGLLGTSTRLQDVIDDALSTHLRRSAPTVTSRA
jgi:GntR family transcriptional repressor for pyruvate dehydrogenase complex